MSEGEKLVEGRALETWQAREMTFPARVRRMKPDHFDRVSGAWQMCLDEARAAFTPGPP